MAILHKITVGDLLVLQVDADPNGGVAAPKGSLAMDSVNGTMHRNTDGSTTWEAVSGTLSHAIAGSSHTASTLADLNAKITDATLDANSASRPAQAHNLGGSEHSADTLANLNAKVSDATLDDSSSTRPPSSHATAHESGGGDALTHDNIAGSGTNSHTQIDNHIGDTDNPHSVTAAQVSAVPTSDKGAANGVCDLDGSGKVPAARLSLSNLLYKGTWNATTNSPALSNSGGGGSQGDYYVVATAGSTEIDGVSDWAVGDWIIHNGSVWEKADHSDAVTSVAGKQGAVTLVEADITDLHSHSNQAQLDLVTDGDHDVRTDNPHSVTAAQVGAAAASHASDHSDGGSAEITAQNLGSGAATAGQIMEANGSGGLTMVDNKVRTASVQTTDATPTTIYSMTVPEGTCVVLHAKVACEDSGDTLRAGYMRTARAHRVGSGAAVLGTVQDDYTDESDAALDCDITVNGNDLRVTVTGKASTTIDWTATILL